MTMEYSVDFHCLLCPPLWRFAGPGLQTRPTLLTPASQMGSLTLVRAWIPLKRQYPHRRHYISCLALCHTKAGLISLSTSPG
jgi:hypothetical protein